MVPENLVEKTLNDRILIREWQTLTTPLYTEKLTRRHLFATHKIWALECSVPTHLPGTGGVRILATMPSSIISLASRTAFGKKRNWHPILAKPRLCTNDIFVTTTEFI